MGGGLQYGRISITYSQILLLNMAGHALNILKLFLLWESPTDLGPQPWSGGLYTKVVDISVIQGF